MTAEERRRLLKEQFSDNKEKEPKAKKAKKEKTAKETKTKKPSVIRKVGAIAAATGILATAGSSVGTNLYDHFSQRADGKSAIVYDKDDAKNNDGKEDNRTKIEKAIDEQIESITGVIDELNEAKEIVLSDENKIFTPEEGKYNDDLFDGKDDNTVGDEFLDQLIKAQENKVDELNRIKNIDDKIEQAEQFGEFKTTSKVVQLETNEDALVNWQKAVKEGQNEAEPRNGQSSFDEIQASYDEPLIYVYDDTSYAQNVARYIKGEIVAEMGNEIVINAAEEGSGINAEGTRVINKDGVGLKQEQEISIVYGARKEIKPSSKVNTPASKPTIKETPVKTPGKDPIVPEEEPKTPVDPAAKVESKSITNPRVPVVQTEDQEAKIPETVTENDNTGVKPTEETQGVNNQNVGPAVNEGHTPTQSFDFDSMNKAIEEYAEAEVEYEDAQTENSEASASTLENQPEEETVRE